MMVKKTTVQTQYCQHHAIFQHLQRPGADVVVGMQRIALTDEILSRDAEGGFYMERE